MDKIFLEEHISINELDNFIQSHSAIGLPESRLNKVNRCREYLDKKLESTSSPLYGINTGFGSLYNKNIANSELSKLQENLVKSHACGTGPEIPSEIVHLMLLLKAHGLAHGHSGVQSEVVLRLLEFYNNDILPIVYQYGSLGASGDLAPLAHLSLPLIGEGEVYYKDTKLTGSEVLSQLKLSPLKLKAKDGLALLNGTQFMSAYASWCIIKAKNLIKWANIIGGLSLDVFDGRLDPFNESVHRLRPHEGQIHTSKAIRTILEGSQLIELPKTHVQDPYSFRCIPQVHGASWEAIEYVSGIVEKEINSVTDNPIVFPEEDKIISAGNFHGQPLALGLDSLAIALSELGSISERRVFQLISGSRNLPNYLVANPGINSGLMIPQYTAAHLASMNKQLSTPSSVDSIVSSNGQEDHVSMGASSAIRCYSIVQNLYSILSIELITATQALEFKRPFFTSPYLERIVGNFRKEVTFIEEDRILHEDLSKSEHFLKTYTLEEI